MFLKFRNCVHHIIDGVIKHI